MAGVFILTSQRSAVRPLACQGIFVTECYHQIHTLLCQDKTTQEAALLLAEPVHSQSGTGRESVDWYANTACGQTVPVPFNSLTPEEREVVIHRVQTQVQAICAKAQTLAQSGDSHHALMAEMLLLALQHPSDDDIWVIGEQAVLIHWGFAPGTVGAQPVDLTRLGTTALAVRPVVSPAPVMPVAPAPVYRSACLGWLWPFLLLLLLLWLLLSTLGFVPLFWPAGCTVFAVDTSRLNELRAKEDALLADIDLLRKSLEERASLCVPSPSPRPEPPKEELVLPPVVEKPQDVPPKKEPPVEPLLIAPPEETAPETEPFLAMTPEAPEPEPKPEPKPKPKPEPKPEPQPKPAPKPQKDDPLNIPDDARKKNDMSFLEGCWRSETGLSNSRTGEPLVAEYCFDKDGKGRRIVRERKGTVCNGGVTAVFDGGGRLTMRGDSAHCPDGTSYVPQAVECTGNNDSTNCKGRELGGRNNKWDARFYRK